MTDRIRICFVGCGQFCRAFVPLFQAHPAVEWVAVTDKFPERCREYDELFHVDRIFGSFEEALDSRDVNAVAIFTQRNMHGKMAIDALRAGKHVYSAVPMSMEPDEILEICSLVRKTGMTYSMGETGHYRPATIFCRRKYRSGEMGDMVFAEAQYNHDMRHLYDVYRYTEGADWKKMAGMPPMTYPTHSTSMILGSCGAHALSVSAFGFTDRTDPDIFGKGKNYWDNPFSNTSMLLQLSNGAAARVSENRRVAWRDPPTYLSSFLGTAASYEFSMDRHSYVRLPGNDAVYEDVSDLLNPPALTAHRGDPDFYQRLVNGEFAKGAAPIQSDSRIPDTLKGFSTDHGGTHKFMVDDFCRAVTTGKLSPTNAWQAARYNLPGLTAHRSAVQGGVLLPVPDPGDPPAGWDVLPSEYD